MSSYALDNSPKIQLNGRKDAKKEWEVVNRTTICQLVKVEYGRQDAYSTVLDPT